MFTTVMYHYVRDLERSRYPKIKGLTVEGFKGQIAYIKRHYHVLSLEECLAALRGEEVLPRNGLLLTFDDGFLDHFNSVFPVLLNEGITGVFFPPGEALADGKVLDVHKIHFILASTDDVNELITDTFHCLDEARSEQPDSIPQNDALWDQYAEATRLDTKEVIFFKRLLQCGLPATIRAKITDQLFKRYVTTDEVAFAAELYLSGDQMRAMFASGMQFGSHGWLHGWLNTMTQQEQLVDIDRSIQFLKDFGVWTPDWVMSYPYGGFDKTTEELLQQRGCKMAFTTEVALSDLKSGAFQLARLDTNDLPRTADAPPQDWLKQQLDSALGGSAK